MNFPSTLPTVICPYTLLGEKSLAWTLLLFDQVLFVHPFPLTLPDSYRPLIEKGWIRILSPERTQEEIREKNRLLKGYRDFVSLYPDQSLLERLKLIRPAEDQESLDDILNWLRGKPSGKSLSPKPEPTFEDEVLLCLIHDWLLQKIDIERSLRKIEDQEALLLQSWEEPLDGTERSGWRLWESVASPAEEPELIYPSALRIWKSLSAGLVKEKSALLTDQKWVWKAFYGETEPTTVLSLPDLGSESLGRAVDLLEGDSEKIGLESIRRCWQTLLGQLETDGGGDPSCSVELEGLIRSIQESLSVFGRPGSDQTRLILPSSPLLLEAQEPRPLLLITSLA